MEKTINAVAARQRLGQLLEETYYRGSAFITFNFLGGNDVQCAYCTGKK